jgi:hypothetical protein
LHNQESWISGRHSIESRVSKLPAIVHLLPRKLLRI